MIERILIANRGDQPALAGAAAQLHCTVAAGRQGGLDAEHLHD
jgi:hypothetical protein